MPPLPDSSIDCLPCRLDWRPSRFGIAAALLLPVAAGVALALSGLPAALGLAAGLDPRLPAGLFLIAGLALGLGAARRTAMRPSLALQLLPAGRIAWEPGGSPLPARLTERWPLVVLRIEPAGPAWVFWPDTLSPAGRRRCRLWSEASPAPLVPPHWMA